MVPLLVFFFVWKMYGIYELHQLLLLLFLLSYRSTVKKGGVGWGLYNSKYITELYIDLL